jgi:hypothetical protein
LTFETQAVDDAAISEATVELEPGFEPAALEGAEVLASEPHHGRRRVRLSVRGAASIGYRRA